jgi:heme-degrading monooxygenase HmoA
MYATRIEVMVAFGKAEAFEERAARQTDVLQSLDGFQARRVLNSLGCPAKYTLLSFWESREAARAGARSSAMRDFVEANPPPEWGTIVRPVEAYEEVHTVEGSASAPGQIPGQVTLVDWTLSPGIDVAEAFEQSRRGLFELQQQHNPGLLRHRLLRYLGAPGRYLAINAVTEYDAMLAAFRQPEIERYLREHPASRYAPGPPQAEHFEPVRVAVPA